MKGGRIGAVVAIAVGVAVGLWVATKPRQTTDAVSVPPMTTSDSGSAGTTGEPPDTGSTAAATGVAPESTAPVSDPAVSRAGAMPMSESPLHVPPRPPGVRPGAFSATQMALARDDAGRPLGVRVESVTEGSRLQRMTVREGDLFLRINGKNLNEPATFEEAILDVEWAVSQAEVLNIRVKRDGKIVTLVELGQVELPGPRRR